jgi:hypothetical protein
MQEWLLPFFLMALVFLYLFKGPMPKALQQQRKWLVGAWALKILFSLAFHWVYSVYYSDKNTGDTWKFFSDAQGLYECSLAQTNGFVSILAGNDDAESPVKKCFDNANYWYNNEEISLINDTRSILRVNFFLMPFSKGNYLFHLFFFSALAFFGMCILFAILQKNYARNPVWINALIAFAIPSIAFWTGGILKESLMLPLFALVLYLIFRKEKTIIHLLLTFLAIILLSAVKFYVGITALLAWLGMIIFQTIQPLPFRKKILLLTGSGLMIFLLLHFLVPPKLPVMMAQKQKAFVNLARGGDYWTLPSGDTIYVPQPEQAYLSNEKGTFLKEGIKYHSWVQLNIKDTLQSNGALALKNCLAKLKASGSAFAIQPIDPSWTGLLKAIPQAFVSALFRPFPNELKNPLVLLAFFENFFFLGMLFLLIIHFFRNNRTIHSQEIFMLIFCFILLSLIGMTTPVTGALVRYRLPVIWIMGLVCAMHWKNLSTLLKRKNKI